MTKPDSNPNPNPSPNRRGLRRTSLGVALIGTLLLGSSLALAGGPHGWFGHRRSHGGFDPEMAQERAQRVADWITRYVEATPEQEAEIDAILSRTIDAFAANRPDPHASRDEFITVLSADTIDRAALEALRQNHLASAEDVSALLVDALADIAEVLTPEQRAELIEAGEHFHGRRERHGGHDGL